MSGPSFSSFPPSFGSFPDIETLDENSESNRLSQKKEDSKSERKHRPRKESRSGKKDKKRHRETRRSDKYDYSDDESKRDTSRQGTRWNVHEAAEPNLFVVDKTGDPMNVVYGGLHTGDIPRYKRFGYGSILGLPISLKIVNRETGGRLLEVGVNGKRPPPRYIEPRSYALLTSAKTRHLVSNSTKGTQKREEEARPEFIPLSSRRDTTEGPLPPYRSIHDTNSASELDSESESSNAASALSGSEGDEGIPHSAQQQAIANLELCLQKDPTSIPLWLSLIDHTMQTAPSSGKSSLAKARTEIRLSILDRAMRTHKQNKASIIFRIMWLHAGAGIWDSIRLETEWELALRELGNKDQDRIVSNTIWNEWFRWRISNAGGASGGQASVEGIMNDAQQVMGNVRGELAMVKVLWRTAIILKNAGYSERAMALFQAQIELSYCLDASLSQPLSSRLAALEEFWEAEVPRIGEPGASGWKTWEQMGKPRTSDLQLPNDPSTSIGIDVDKPLDPYVRWAADESHIGECSTMPKRTDESMEDPYATVLFADIRPLLINIQTAEARHALRLAWIDFMGLHIPGLATFLSQGEYSHDDIWAQNHLAQKGYLQRLFPPKDKDKERVWDAFGGTVVAKETTYGQVFGCVKEWGRGVLPAIESTHFLAIWDENDVDGVDKSLMRRIFEQLRRQDDKLGSEDEEWDLLAIAFEATVGIKSATKLSRSILSTNRSSLVLWHGYACLERVRGKLDEARRVYETALDSVDAKTRGAAELWWAWAEMEWLKGDDERARCVISMSTGSGNKATAMSMLRCKRTLDERIQGHFHWKDREAWACLRALLDVLAGGVGAIEEGMYVLQRYIKDANLQCVQRESAWTKMLLLEWKHTALLHRQVRRGRVRQRVGDVLQQLQEEGTMNTAILGVFLEGEKGESVWGRVKALSAETEGRIHEKGVVRRVWEIWLANWERGRWEKEKERVRTSLAIAVNEERTKASPILWRIYIEFEIRCDELKRAKNLLFRAVAECPLVKELYLLAFGPLRTVFTTTELDAWGETMAERGLRLHHELEEYVKAVPEWERNSGDDENSEDTGEDTGEVELEDAANEYRRLAPF